ncbi:xanthine dehydrogenase YagR molybdenum-binding subunit [Faunimonas pinastri]|uniref:Xanthine dehydrogenase YagR molybdenum-binding subunit n=1 Tax=Faunimonas pinastri TaxID=1855383 RepID=A0A1H9A3Y4_9HYPH|nr:xanthine dehydrogenase family protein molybdopterin-binding subunit [Faunimonas pinastri]SEP71167.1 xanthine dehydrogenase YagR molybdenum-binding subunit [Faunimonas pinastri]
MNVAVPPPKENMGQPVARLEARSKVTGEARYSADFPLNNLAHGVLVTSAIAAGSIKSLDLEAARAVPGVIEIFTQENVKGLKDPKFGQGNSSSVQPFNGPKIWHDEQMLALVVANTHEAAEDAAYRLRASYDETKPSATFDSPGSQTLDAVGNTESHKEDPKLGDVEAALATAPVKIDVKYSTPTQHHNPIELFSTTASWQDDKLTIYEPSQFVYGYKNGVAEQLGVDPANVRVVSPLIGGAFGSKGPMTPRTAVVAYAARALNRPIRCVVSRMQGFTTATYRAETRHHIRMGATPDGRIVAYSHEGWEVTSRPDNYVVGGTETTSLVYAYGAVGTRVQIVKADRNTPGYMRSPPETPYMYALESAMDEMAAALKMDPVEFRRVNDTQKEPIKGRPYTSRSLMTCYDQAAEAFGWKKRNPAVGSMRDGDWLIGMGCSTAIYPTNIGPAAVRVRLSPKGEVRIETAAHEIGTGIRTVAGQMAAEPLGLDMKMVTVETGDTDFPPAPVAGGSNSTASVCSAVLVASNRIRDRLFRAAVTSNDGPLAGRNPGDLGMKGGMIVAADGASVKLADLFGQMGSGVIEEYVEHTPEGMPPESMAKLYSGQSSFKRGSQGDKIRFAFGAEFVEVRIHSRTREIRIPRIVGAFAGGRIMNPRTARSQLMGGMIWGIGAGLLEATEIDPRAARYVNRDLAEYMVAVNADVNQLEVILVPEEDHEVNEAGVKGVGELGNVGTPAAIQAAVFHATGKRIRDLPIRLDDLLNV